MTRGRPGEGFRTEHLHSFVVPAHGQSPHLADCLASLVGQTRRSQIVVATATPFDGLAELVRGHGARLVVNPAGGGIGRDWNFALAQAATPWVTLAHQDDIYLPAFTERTMALATARPDMRIVFTGYRELLDGRERGATAMLAIKRLLLERGFLGRRAVSGRAAKLRLLTLGCPIPCPSATLRLDGFPLRFREDMKVNLDWEAWTRLASAEGAFGYARASLMLHRIHDSSETSAGVRDGARAREDLSMFRQFWPDRMARMLARAYARSYQSAPG